MSLLEKLEVRRIAGGDLFEDGERLLIRRNGVVLLIHGAARKGHVLPEFGDVPFGFVVLRIGFGDLALGGKRTEDVRYALDAFADARHSGPQVDTCGGQETAIDLVLWEVTLQSFRQLDR